MRTGQLQRKFCQCHGTAPRGCQDADGAGHPVPRVQRLLAIDGQDMGEINGNNLTMTCNVEANGETTIVIETVVNYSAGRTEAESITNIAYAEVFGERIANTQDVYKRQ